MKNKKIKISSNIFFLRLLRFSAKAVSLIMTVLILFIMIPAAVFAINDANNKEKQKVKVYLSEPLGAGKEVFHVTKCTKIVRKAELRCSEVNANGYADQCKDPQGGVILGRKIRKCLDNKNGREVNLSRCKQGEQGVHEVNKMVEAWGLLKCENYDDLQTCVPEYYVAADNPSVVEAEFREIAEIEVGPLPPIVQIFEIEKCDEGDFYVKDKGYVDKSGTVTAWPSELGDECKTVNNLMFGSANDMGKDLITCTRGERIASSSGTGLLSEFIGAIYRWAAGIGGIIAILVMVISGIQISMAGGTGESIDKAKTRIKDSIIALVILFLSGLILYTINPTFFT